ncbi:hypothetical protein ACB087_10305 (plasmid) [Vibrio sp. VNB-15]
MLTLNISTTHPESLLNQKIQARLLHAPDTVIDFQYSEIDWASRDCEPDGILVNNYYSPSQQSIYGNAALVRYDSMVIKNTMFNPVIQLTDEEEQELQIFEKQQYQMTLISGLGTSGFTKTNDKLHAFAGKLVAKAKETFQQKPIQCRLWGFRHGDYEMLSCDLLNGDKSQRMPITITACYEQNLEDLNEPDVYDMVEALHLASLIIHGLDAHIETGRHGNEVSKRLLARPLKGNETNGKIKLWKS